MSKWLTKEKKKRGENWGKIEKLIWTKIKLSKMLAKNH